MLLKYGLDDIRDFYKNDVRWLRQMRSGVAVMTGVGCSDERMKGIVAVVARNTSISTVSPRELAHRLTMAGLEAEKIEEIGADWDRDLVRVARVKEVRQDRGRGARRAGDPRTAGARGDGGDGRAEYRGGAEDCPRADRGAALRRASR